ncbi:glycosyltransferase [Lentzea flaviverrucosa]|uniref:Galactofuranosylgalactofuranosylrhamnosyl-N-acetylglucosaminyl-diphospho-decaprenol beta-1,5/1,6-galactofuranosyltransferase n=1 Tax=Lentzea flaviverrucosa TaxID=200379 RepID=A0A1H9XVI9_9PSEU|nr:glycosyltransferase [Lentzea flaviverrucosa]RDI18688.1 galactofuranosylgalactofuranosylrhamnosyl-N-acetylglucosaminyl-diphospho-decaprenol beta-1,5/1,6-galactofuranosyltransferase [Lentzea flaviverrucosa]SES50089.1 galactofuranosylgalactofuranosylrhamnosyl-N-acetylglucosaminyl-diphospho-decaprenol beta-1,5/1,6-galactofuranosyltransferase [Lentzea flaviverrucosa]
MDQNCVLQRVILPRDDDPLDVRPLYLDEPDSVHCHVASRRSTTVPPSAKVSFSTYFNAFPASYWKRWTTVDEVVLRMAVRGTGRVDVYRSRPSGDIIHIEGQYVRDAAEWTDVEFTVSLKPFEDGGWIWFDVFTDDAPLEIREAAWTVREPLPVQTVAIGMTTMRPVDAVIALRALGQDKAVLDVLCKVFVADQGAVKVRDTEGFAEAAALLGDKLQVIEQDNLGGSGGFTRGMFEAIENTDADQIMLMDDDIRLEPDAVLRSNAFARAAAQPVIVGSHMLNLYSRARLHSFAEIVDLNTCFWRAAPGAVTDHNFATDSLRDTKELHPRVNATYNGWWMCLFPREVVRRSGYPLPLFIKWDDAEYSLRALEHGFPTVSLPGSAVWHMPWTDKNDSTDWQAYFHTRNRLILAALHSPYDVKNGIVKHGLKLTLRHLLSMEYSTVMLQQKAIEDFLAGPSLLFDSLRTALPEVRKLRAEYSDAQTLPSAREFPPPTFDQVRAEALLQPSQSKITTAKRAAKSLLHNLRSPEPDAAGRPQMNVPALSARWFLLGNLDSATVSTADGTAVAFYKRDPQEFRALAKRAARNYRRLGQEWDQLKRVYRAALPELTSTESWRKVFEG